MNKLNIPHITAKQYICLKQMKQFEYENIIKYKRVFLNTYNDIVENGYNISMLWKTSFYVSIAVFYCWFIPKQPTRPKTRGIYARFWPIFIIFVSINISLFELLIFMMCKIRGGSLTKLNFLIIISNNIIFFTWFIRFIRMILQHVYSTLDYLNNFSLFNFSPKPLP